MLISIQLKNAYISKIETTLEYGDCHSKNIDIFQSLDYNFNQGGKYLYYCVFRQKEWLGKLVGEFFVMKKLIELLEATGGSWVYFNEPLEDDIDLDKILN